MSSSWFLPSLNLVTLVVGLLIAIAALVYFMRRRSNRHPLEGRRERNVAQDIDAGRVPPDNSPRK